MFDTAFHKMRATLAIAALTAGIALSLPALAQTASPGTLPAGVYVSDETHTSVTFKVSHMGLSHYTARFARAEAELTFDPADPTKSSVKASVDPLSLRTDYPYPDKKDFDKELSAGAEWLNGEKFPTITFTSTRIEKTGETTGKMHGDLTLLGVTKPVTLDVTFNGAYTEHPMGKMPAMGFSAQGTVKRSDFGFNTYLPMIGDDVTILIEIEFKKKDA